MLTSEIFFALESRDAVEICRFFNKGIMVYQHLQNRTITISLENLKKVPLSLAFAYGSQKSAAILAVLRAMSNHLVTDEATILKC